ncbi:MAG: PAS domain-containing protein [Planctomycetota bacterium]
MSVMMNTASQNGTFVPDELFSRLGNLSRGDADGYDFGIIKTDEAGKILLYNQYEQNLAGIPASQAEGRNFFTQVAPCSNNGLFFGSFKKGVAADQLNLAFPYTFTFKMKPTAVNIHLYRDPASKTNWIFVKVAG